MSCLGTRNTAAGVFHVEAILGLVAGFPGTEAAEAQNRYPRVYGEGLVAEMASAALPRYWPTPLLTPMCQTLAACACLLSQEPCEQYAGAGINMQG